MDKTFEELKKEKSMQMYFYSKYKLKISASAARAIRKEINSVKTEVQEECAMIFESQISEDNTDSANIDLKINAKAIRDKE